MKKRIISIMLCMILCLSSISSMEGTVTTAEAKEKPQLCLINGADFGNFLSYRTEGSDDMQGVLPFEAVVELLEVNGELAKIKYKGSEYFVKSSEITKVDTPNIVSSKWAMDWLSYTGNYIGLASEWSGVKGDYTKPITREKTVEMIIGVMNSIYGEYFVSSNMTKGYKSTKITGPYNRAANQLARWGVLRSGKFVPNDTISYQEVTTMLVKLMEYDKQIIREGGGKAFTKADIKKFQIGGKKDAKAKCTIEQAKVLCDKTFCWWTEMQYKVELKYDKGKTKQGTWKVASGDQYTIQTCLGKEPKQPFVVINKEGQGELSSKKSQKYKINFKKVRPDEWGQAIVLCTIKTKDGEYLATSGVPLNGSRLITQKKEYVWRVMMGEFVDDQQVCYILNPDNFYQALSISESKTNDGTPIISHFWNGGTGGDNHNSAFIFERVK